MKRLIAVGGTLIVLFSAFNANARSLHPLTFVLSAELTEVMNIDQDSYLSDMRIYGGKVKIKQLRKEITLELEHAPVCPTGMFCPQVLVTHAITLPITEQYVGDCGSNVYVALKDARPVDGALEKIVVTDYTSNKCPHFIALPETGITLETSFFDRMNGKEVSTHSSFEAGKLVGRVLPTSDLEKVLPAIQ